MNRIDRLFTILCIVGLAYVAISLLSGCSYNPKPLTWEDGLERCACSGQIQVIDLDSEISGATSAAMDHWNAILGRDLFIRSEAGSTVIVYVADTDDPDTKALTVFRRTRGRIRGCNKLLEIRVSPEAAKRDQQLNSVTIAHELGHVLGLGHSPYKASLMYVHASSMPAAAFRIPSLEEEETELVKAMWGQP